jgi:hypothetical protein
MPRGREWVPATIFIVLVVVLGVQRYGDRQEAVRVYGTPLAARVVDLSEVETTKRFWLIPDLHYRWAMLEVTTIDGQTRTFGGRPVKQSVVLGQGLRAWIADPYASGISDYRRLYHEQASATAAYDDPWSPFLRWRDVIGSSIYLSVMIAGFVYLCMCLDRRSDDGGTGPSDPDEPDDPRPDDPPGGIPVSPVTYSDDELYRGFKLPVAEIPTDSAR